MYNSHFCFSHQKLLPEPPHPQKMTKVSLASIVNTASSLERTRMVSVWMMMMMMMMMILIMPTGEDIYDGCGSDSIHHDTLL
jgi:hypothetical protein